jgi:hypothetical protein
MPGDLPIGGGIEVPMPFSNPLNSFRAAKRVITKKSDGSMRQDPLASQKRQGKTMRPMRASTIRISLCAAYRANARNAAPFVF